MVKELLADDPCIEDNVLERDGGFIVEFWYFLNAPDCETHTVQWAQVATRFYLSAARTLREISGRRPDALMIGMFMTDFANWLFVTDDRFRVQMRRTLSAATRNGFHEYVAEWYGQWKLRVKRKPKKACCYRFESTMPKGMSELAEVRPAAADVVEAVLTKLVKNNFVCGTVPAAMFVMNCCLQGRRFPETLNGQLKLFRNASKFAQLLLDDESIRFCGFCGWWNKKQQPVRSVG